MNLMFGDLVVGLLSLDHNENNYGKLQHYLELWKLIKVFQNSLNFYPKYHIHKDREIGGERERDAVWLWLLHWSPNIIFNLNFLLFFFINQRHSYLWTHAFQKIFHHLKVFLIWTSNSNTGFQELLLKVSLSLSQLCTFTWSGLHVSLLVLEYFFPSGAWVIFQEMNYFCLKILKNCIYVTAYSCIVVLIVVISQSSAFSPMSDYTDAALFLMD